MADGGIEPAAAAAAAAAAAVAAAATAAAAVAKKNSGISCLCKTLDQGPMFVVNIDNNEPFPCL